MVIASRRQSRVATGGTNFARHSLAITNSASIAYWRLRPVPSGVAEELLGVGMNGTFTNVTFPFDAHGPSGLHVPYFDGSAGLANIYSSDLNTNIDTDKISISIWGKVDDIAQWTDSTKRVLFRIAADANNYLEISKSTSDDVIDFTWDGASTVDTEAVSTLTDNESPVVFFHVGMTIDYSGDSMFTYFNGVQGTEQTGLGQWSGVLDSDLCLVGGSAVGTPADQWQGYASDLIVYSEILPASEMLALANVR